MKPLYLLYVIYQWLIAAPILIVLTILTAVLTIVLAPIFPNSQLSYFPARWWSRLCCWLLFIRVKTNGFEHLNKNQSYIFIANHQSIFDIFVIYGWIPFIFKWIMKNDLIKIPFVGMACATAGHIFIDRSNPIAAKHSIEKAADKLKHGNSVVVFPEGTRTRTGKMGKFKRGAFMLAQELALPLVPITLSGSFERLHRNTLKVHPGIITMTVHAPISPDTFTAENTNEIMQKAYKTIESGLQPTIVQ